MIPYSAALVTGRRAIVYVELPLMPRGVEPALQGVSTAVDRGNVEQVRQAFAVLSNVLDRPYDQPGTDYARGLWNRYADRLAEQVFAGRRVETKQQATNVLARLDRITSQMREQFGPVGQPTFEGREIVLGPRAGNYYLARHGLKEGELVVTQGNFKIDAEIQIQAKPSMMTPTAGEGRGKGHDHRGSGEHAGHMRALPASFNNQIVDLQAAYEQVRSAVEQEDIDKITAAFSQLDRALKAVDGSSLSGTVRKQWKEFDMLLGNDAFEGRHVDQVSEADKIFLSLKGIMRRMRDQLGISTDIQPQIEQIAVSPPFQADLATVWQRYVAIQEELAADQFNEAKDALTGLEAVTSAVDDSTLTGRALQVWKRERSNLSKLIEKLRQAPDIAAMRATFKPLSEEIGVLAKSFGFGEAGPIHELHCPMAFQNKGAIWYQDNEQVRNPYFGSSMLRCADRVEELKSSAQNDL